jgi:hypothetical protein
MLRVDELVKKGNPGVLPMEISDLRPTKEDSRDYLRLREDGTKVHQARLAYMNARFGRGEHPDTHPAFWSEWKEPAFPVLKRIGGPEDEVASIVWKVIALVAAVILAGVYVGWRIRTSVRRRRGLLY